MINPINRTSFISFIEQKGSSIPIPFDDGNLTEDQKRNKLIHWLDTNPAFFFDQVRPHLPPELVTLWKDNNNLETIDRPPTPKVIIPSQRHNRRYHYLIHHLRHSDYFSDESIQLRVPSLYEEYIGQLIPDKERYAPFGNDVSLVDRVYDGMNRRYVQDQWQQKQRSEEEQLEEQDDDEDDDDDSVVPLGELPTNLSVDLRQEKKNELIRLLEEQWLDGLDDQYDYSAVDHDDTYDDLVQQNQDIQDRYFDDELEEENGPNNDTGILDY
ncbi:coiled-coil domain-containing protein-domain-containing protein [Chlamydoabsidia padenii]|nr:coiled-coil domain-containing protein-domain-containing protein [Chlamydoabsidia padenii]